MPRETMEVDVVYVGGGPAALASALYLKRLVSNYNSKVDKEGTGQKLQNPQIVILEKGTEFGAHSLSGAVMDTRFLQELFPDIATMQCPFECDVSKENMYFMTKKRKFPVLFTPPSMHNKGFKLISLGKFVKWMSDIAQQNEIEIFPGFPGVKLLEEDSKVVGVQTGDTGIDKDGKPKSNFQPGVDIRAKITILAEGTRGHLTKQLVKSHKLANFNPMCYATGVKELWELPDDRFPAGKIVHSMGWPLTSSQFGGSFLYGLPNRKLAIGFVVGLDYKDPYTDPHRMLQILKTHPYVAAILAGGKLERYGAKTIPEGGYWAIPKLYGNGFMIIGDSAGMVNVMRLKGIHLAMKSGMLASEAILQALQKNDFSENTLAEYHKLWENSPIKKELWGVRNFRQGYHHSFWRGMFHTALQFISGGRGLWGRYSSMDDCKSMRKVSEVHGKDTKPPAQFPGDKQLTFDKLTSVFYSASKHEENQPCHLQISDPNICVTRCTEEYGNPCQYFCPAQVYEIVEDEKEKGKKKLQINFSNCVHCKTCDIMDPYEIITWVAPEGGGGPKYTVL